MGPFTQRPSERNDQNAWERPEREFHLRAMRDDEVSQPNRFGFDEREDADPPYHQDKDIRNLGFFKEQERQFTQSEDEEEWQERQSPINFVLISCIFVVLCVVGWFGYRWVSKPVSGEPPLITAEQDPIKVRPENPGGMIIPHQDKLIYGRIAPSQQQPIEHLLPAPEQPITPPPPPQVQPQTFVDANGQVYYAYPVPQQPTASQQQHQNQQPYTQQHGYTDYYDQTQENNYTQGTPPVYQQIPQHSPQPGTQAPYVHPQQQKPVMAQQQGNSPQPGYAHPPVPQNPAMAQQNLVGPLQPAPHTQHPAPPAAPAVAQAPSNIQPGPHPQQVPLSSGTNTLDQLIEQEMEGPAFKKPQPEEEHATTKAKKQKTKLTSSPYKLQVATLDTKADADEEVKRIRSIDKNLFNDKIISIEPITLSGTKKPSYRVIINGFETPNSATQFSNKLKIHKVKGIVLRQPT